MNKILGLALYVVLFNSCSSSNKSFDWSQDNYTNNNLFLELNANSTIRYSETTLDVIDEGSATYTLRKAFTVSNKEDQEELSRILIWYDEFRSVNFINARIINNDNVIVRTFDESDAEDYSAFSGFTFFSDNRVKVLDLFHNTYPYTIELEYELSLTGLLYLPTWSPQQYYQSVEKAKFKLIDRNNTGVRFYQKNLDNEPKIGIKDGIKVVEWEITNETAKEREAYGPAFEEIMPLVYVAPGKFQMDESRGDATTWESFGKWYYELGKETRELSDEAKLEVDDVVNGLESEELKVRAIYDYLQKKTRYVSIQLGIGGWKPFEANYVYEKEYGDCKALTNYMQAVLDYVGIKSNAVLIQNGVATAQLLHDFPSNQFNHVIVKVTLENGEIIWLECTSKYMPPGEIGTGNENKFALQISKNGGELIKTPTSSANDNSILNKNQIQISENGDALINSTAFNKGHFQFSVIHNLLPISEQKRLQWLEKSVSLSNAKINNVDFYGINDELNSNYAFTLTSESYASNTASRLFIPLNKLNRWKLNPPEYKNRNQDIWLGFNFSEYDTTTYYVPNGYKLESRPSDITIDNRFGSYEAKVVVNSDTEIEYQRSLVINENRFSAKLYSEFKSFFDQVSEADASQIVLRKEN